jgi:hypothetical protein
MGRAYLEPGRVALGVGFDVRDISPPPKALSEPDKRLSHIRLLTLHRSGAFVLAPYPFQLRAHAIVPLGVGRMRLLARVMVCVVPFARRALPRFFANLAAFPGTIPRPGALAAAPFTLHAVTRPEVRPMAFLSPRTFNPFSGPGLAWLAL